MTSVDPTVLRRLREAKGWTQDRLAEKTKIDKQTISRLERGGRSTNRRRRTIEQLAGGLGVEPGVLTGEMPVPEMQREAGLFDTRSQFNVRVANGPRNALSLVAQRYSVDPSQIVEIAPFLFLCAAEDSLRQRRERAKAVSEKLGEVEALSGHLAHLEAQLTALLFQDQAISAEHASIEERDLLGSSMQLDFPPPRFDEDADNPFARYLRKLGEQFAEAAKFERWSASWAPQYEVCPDEAAAQVGGDRERAEEILSGQVALHEMPKEIRQPEMAAKRAEWVRLKAQEYREDRQRKLHEMLAEILASDDGERQK